MDSLLRTRASAQPGVTWGTAWLGDAEYWRDRMTMVRWFARAAEV